LNAWQFFMTGVESDVGQRAMSNPKPQRYEQGRPMLFAGIRRTHTFASMSEEIPRQWEEFVRLGTLPEQVGKAGYGAICGGDAKAQTMEYMCAAEVASFDALPKDLGRMRVPAARYAVFLHEGNVATIQQTWQHIFSTWLPSSGLRSGNTPDFEAYDERFDGATGEGGVEIWLSVQSEN
jgi:predicted transcriptional regulator YdeE